MGNLNIETQSGRIQKNNMEIFNFLSNLNNFEGLIKDQYIKNWQSTENYCTFEVEGAGSIGFIIDEKIPGEKISYKNYGNVPFDYIMTINMTPVSENETEIKIEFDADVNPVIKMMIKNPLKNLLNQIISKLDTLKF